MDIDQQQLKEFSAHNHTQTSGTEVKHRPLRIVLGWVTKVNPTRGGVDHVATR